MSDHHARLQHHVLTVVVFVPRVDVLCPLYFFFPSHYVTIKCYTQNFHVSIFMNRFKGGHVTILNPAVRFKDGHVRVVSSSSTVT